MVLKTEHMVVCIIIALLIGAGTGFIYGQFSTTGCQDDIERLEAESIQSDAEIQRLGVEMMELQSELLQAQKDRDVYANRYETLGKKMASLMNCDINVSDLTVTLMAPRAEHKWEEGRNNPDFQALLVVQIATQWADDLYEKLKVEFEKRGGGVIRLYRYSFLSSGCRGHLITSLNQGMVIDFIEYYGMNHTAILFIGGPEAYNFLSGTPPNSVLDGLAVIGISPCTSTFAWLQNPPWI